MYSIIFDSYKIYKNKKNSFLVFQAKLMDFNILILIYTFNILN